jgi:hypothetical protein
VIRELVLALMILLVCGPLMWLAGLWSGGKVDSDQPCELERKRWTQIWFPHLPSALAAALLVGWALQETPVSDEALHPIALAVAVAFGLWWARALARALRSLLRPEREPLAATRGLLVPQIRIGAELAAALDADELAAVQLHEAAHARHRDPLRIWLAQLACDLQFPTRKVKQRFDRWLHALELARDDEARRAGADGTALASAIVTAARMQGAFHRAPCGILGHSCPLEERVARLLAPLPAPSLPSRVVPVLMKIGLALLLLGDLTAGVVLGDDLVRAIPGVLP